jgi:hypothetical protein
VGSFFRRAYTWWRARRCNWRMLSERQQRRLCRKLHWNSYYILVHVLMWIVTILRAPAHRLLLVDISSSVYSFRYCCRFSVQVVIIETYFMKNNIARSISRIHYLTSDTQYLNRFPIQIFSFAFSKPYVSLFSVSASSNEYSVTISLNLLFELA